MQSILFNTEMVQAILEGRKTVTRRKIKLDLGLADTDKNDKNYLKIPNDQGDYHDAVDYCRYQVGDVLYVRETWQDISDNEGNYIYKANSNNGLVDIGFVNIPIENIKWRPSIHMPKAAARIFLRVTDIRVERLKDITEEQAKKEGVEVETNNSGIMYRCNFMDLWNSTIKKDDLFKYSWKANPWVYVIDFEVMKGSAINELYSGEYKK